MTRTVLFLLCAIPFWTSGIIRTIAWIPFLGRNGAFNQILMGLALTSHPLTFLLFSDFAVIVTYVHLFTLLMVGPIANSLSKIDPALLEAARRCRRQPLAHHGRRGHSAVEDRHRSRLDPGVHPGDGRLFRGQAMSGGQSASIVSMLSTQIQAMEYPPASANAMVLVIVRRHHGGRR